MSYEVVAEGKLQVLDCGEVMDIAAVAELHTQLQMAREAKQPVVLDASRVERADTAALQMLIAFIQDANAQQQTVQWKAPSESLSVSAELLDLSSLLKLPINQDG